MAAKLESLEHKNLVNFTRKIKYYDNDVKDGLLEISSECPEHIGMWKCFCKK